MFFSRAARAAFTIIELLLVIAIVIFLVKILVPRYSQYYTKARQAEVAINLSAAYTAQQTYQVEHGRYALNLQELGWQPRGYTSDKNTTQNYYTYSAGHGAEGAQVFTGSSGTPASALGQCEMHSDRFSIKAAAKKGDTVDVWSIDESGELRRE